MRRLSDYGRHVRVVHRDGLGGLTDGILSLALAADEKDFLPAGDDIAKESSGGIELLGGLRNVDNVDVVTLPEDIGTHSGVPLAGLVSEVDTGFDQLRDEFVGHVRGGRLLAGGRGIRKAPWFETRVWFPRRALAGTRFPLVQGMVGSGRALTGIFSENQGKPCRPSSRALQTAPATTRSPGTVIFRLGSRFSTRRTVCPSAATALTSSVASSPRSRSAA